MWCKPENVDSAENDAIVKVSPHSLVVRDDIPAAELIRKWIREGGERRGERRRSEYVRVRGQEC